MSIATEISRIQSAKTALKTSINAKTDEQHQITNETIDNYASFVDSITGGGSGGVYEVNSVAEMEQLTGMSEDDYCVVKGSTFPSGYTQLEYLQSSGTQYIDTGYAPYKTKSEVKFQKPSSSNVFEYIMATYNANDNRYYVAMYDYYNNTFTTANRSNTSTSLSSYNSNVHTVIYNDENNKVLFDNTVKATVSDLTQQGTYNIYLFANHVTTGVQYNFTGRIYYVKITDKDTGNLVRNFVSCKRNSDNVLGMYDLVNDVFYTNAGTGSFTGGNEIENPYYTLYQYNGTSWVQYGEEYLYPSTTVQPTTSQQIVPIPTGYMGLKEVIVNGVEHTGAYKASSVAEMNAITDMQSGDVCIIYTGTALKSKNLFNINGTYTNASGTSHSVSGDSLTVSGKYNCRQLITVTANTDYYVSFTRSTEYGNIAVFNSNLTAYIHEYESSGYTFNSGNNTSIMLTMRTDGDDYTSRTATFNNIQLEQGTSPTSYERYYPPVDYMLYQYNGTSWVEI